MFIKMFLRILASDVERVTEFSKVLQGHEGDSTNLIKRMTEGLNPLIAQTIDECMKMMNQDM